MIDLTPITLPADWNAEKDCRYFLEWGEPGCTNHTENLWEQARFHHGNYLAAIRRALRCAYACDATIARIEPGCLPPLEKIEIVLDSVRRRPQVYADPARLQEQLLACQVAEAERARVLRDYRVAGDQAWMYPVIELIDLFGNVAAELRDTLHCEEEARPGKTPRPRR